jgi:uncharacterized PurR-regulated membrane protein YhhQ (DUF165 family)
VFVLVATIAGVFGRELFLSLVLTNYVLKCGIEVLMTPFTYALVHVLKKAEGIDVYDRGLKYSPFFRLEKTGPRAPA